jgi:hypothetical protein
MLYDTRAKKIAFIRKKGNIVTFKYGGEQFIITELEKFGDNYILHGDFGKATFPQSMDNLLKSIAWERMEKWHNEKLY